MRAANPTDKPIMNNHCKNDSAHGDLYHAIDQRVCRVYIMGEKSRLKNSQYEFFK